MAGLFITELMKGMGILMEKLECIMLVGLPGSGKSTLAKKLVAKKPDRVIVSSDSIREELYGSEAVQGKPSEVFDIVNERIEMNIKAGNSVILDACNVWEKHRINLIKKLKKLDITMKCIICATPYEVCVKRDLERNRKVSEHNIKKMYFSFSTPYYYEGFDDIAIYYSEGSKGYYGEAKDFADKYMDYNQDNPHHQETLGEHVLAIRKNTMELSGCDIDSNLAWGAYLHDCGKIFAKAFKGWDGEPSEIAHYYGHQFYGALNALCYNIEGKSDKDMIEISKLVNLHMAPFDWGESGKSEKMRKLWGDELYNNILMIHEADLKASKSDMTEE